MTAADVQERGGGPDPAGRVPVATSRSQGWSVLAALVERVGARSTVPEPGGLLRQPAPVPIGRGARLAAGHRRWSRWGIGAGVAAVAAAVVAVVALSASPAPPTRTVALTGQPGVVASVALTTPVVGHPGHLAGVGAGSGPGPHGVDEVDVGSVVGGGQLPDQRTAGPARGAAVLRRPARPDHHRLGQRPGRPHRAGRLRRLNLADGWPTADLHEDRLPVGTLGVSSRRAPD